MNLNASAISQRILIFYKRRLDLKITNKQERKADPQFGAWNEVI